MVRPLKGQKSNPPHTIAAFSMFFGYETSRSISEIDDGGARTGLRETAQHCELQVENGLKNTPHGGLGPEILRAAEFCEEKNSYDSKERRPSIEGLWDNHKNMAQKSNLQIVD